MIENGTGVEGIINCLLALIDNDNFYARYTCNMRTKVRYCKIDGEIALVILEAKDENYENEFMTCAKKLQGLISSTKKGG
jgi:hypothetical protein